MRAPLARDLAPRREVLRRAVDLAVVLLAAPLALAVLAVLAILIKLDSPGPVLWGHERVGRDGRRFPLFKLRTMVSDADEQKAALAHLNVLPWPDFKIPDDPRVTRVGAWLRRSSLDELPQLWNLARGEVTLIGPRPCSVPTAHYKPWQTERLDVTPGLLGRWQADGRGRVDFDSRCRLDIAQARTRSPRAEAVLALKSIVAVARLDGGK